MTQDMHAPPWRRPTALHSFTLIELLVVVAILSLLASLLVPNLVRAVERSRRIACLSNMRQIYTSCVVYTENHNGLLPYTKNLWAEPRLSATTFYMKTRENPLLLLLMDYLGMKIYQYDTSGPRSITEPTGREPYFCPSYDGWILRNTGWVGSTGTVVYGDDFAYVFAGAGRYSDFRQWVSWQDKYYEYLDTRVWTLGCPRLDRMGGPLGPVAFLKERWYGQTNNHNWAGLTVMSEKGEGRWVDFGDLRNNSNYYWPKAYYYASVLDPGDEFTAHYPDEPADWNKCLWGWQPEYTNARRAVFGYPAR